MAEVPRLRVLVLAGWYPNEDHPHAGIFVRNQVQALARVCDVAVLYVHLGTEGAATRFEIEDEVPTVRAYRPVGDPSTRIDHLRSLWALTAGYSRSVREAYRTLEEAWGRPDIVHAHVFYPAACGALVLKQRYGIPYVVTEHSSECLPQDGGFWRKGRTVRRWMMRAGAESSRNIAVSHSQGQALVACRLIEGFDVVPNVVRDCSPGIRGQRPVDGRIAHLATLGDVSKNTSLLIGAAARLADTRDDFELRIVGDGPGRDSLKELAGSLGILGSRVVFLGRQSPADAMRSIASSRFLVVSSRFETFSMAAAESLMCGRPVLTTRCGGPEDFVDDEVGRLVAVDSIEELQSGIDFMLDHADDYSPDLLHARARASFSGNVIVGKLLDVYRVALGA